MFQKAFLKRSNNTRKDYIFYNTFLIKPIAVNDKFENGKGCFELNNIFTTPSQAIFVIYAAYQETQYGTALPTRN